MAELRRVEEVLGDTTRQLKAVEGEEEALRAKVGHLRHEADIAQRACDRARAAEAAVQQACLFCSPACDLKAQSCLLKSLSARILLNNSEVIALAHGVMLKT